MTGKEYNQKYKQAGIWNHLINMDKQEPISRVCDIIFFFCKTNQTRMQVVENLIDNSLTVKMTPIMYSRYKNLIKDLIDFRIDLRVEVIDNHLRMKKNFLHPEITRIVKAEKAIHSIDLDFGFYLEN